jgi:chromosomal replication initiation ATPase DnaA
VSEQLTARALSTAAALLNAAAIGDRFEMRRLLRSVNEPGTEDPVGSVVRAVAMAHHVDVGHILGNTRRREVTRARMTVCYIAAEIFGHGYAPTGRALNCDHTTVMHAVRRVSADPEWRTAAEEIAERLGWRVAS